LFVSAGKTYKQPHLALFFADVTSVIRPNATPDHVITPDQCKTSTSNPILVKTRMGVQDFLTH